MIQYAFDTPKQAPGDPQRESQVKGASKSEHFSRQFHWLDKLYYRALMSASAQAVYAALLRFAHFRRMTCYPSQEKISENTGLSRKTVSIALAELQLLGLVKAQCLNRFFATHYLLAVTPSEARRFAQENNLRSGQTAAVAQDRVDRRMARYQDRHDHAFQEWIKSHDEKASNGQMIYNNDISPGEAERLLKAGARIAPASVRLYLDELDTRTILNGYRNAAAEQEKKKNTTRPIMSLAKYLAGILNKCVNDQKTIARPSLAFCRMLVKAYETGRHENHHLYDECLYRLEIYERQRKRFESKARRA